MNRVINNELKVSKQVSELTDLYLNIWWRTKTEFPLLKEETSYWHKKNQEKETDKFIDQFFKAIEQFPEEEKEREKCKQNVEFIIDSYIKKSDLISLKDRDILLKDDLIFTTESFAREVKKFNSNMNVEDTGQAMRNVWIMNLIQLLFCKKPQLTPSIFAYSMLYPYTDNYLDDTEISLEEKIRISNAFEKRLAGQKLKPANNYEESLYKLVDKIEEQYDRGVYPEIFESLLCIHYAQGKSLQQQDVLSGPYEKDILGISIEKGGTSVLADAYLVNGTLTEKEAAFFFGYGVLLQICDDLQDCKKDFQGKHSTIISQLYKRWYLDNITNKLINFTYDLMENIDYFDCENKDELKSLICKNCINLILFAVAKNKNMYSRRYLIQIKKYLPFRTKYIIGVNKKLKRKFDGSQIGYKLFI